MLMNEVQANRESRAQQRDEARRDQRELDGGRAFACGGETRKQARGAAQVRSRNSKHVPSHREPQTRGSRSYQYVATYLYFVVAISQPGGEYCYCEVVTRS